MNLKEQLEEALSREDYEQAAVLRDRIAAGEVDVPVSLTTNGILAQMGWPEYMKGWAEWVAPFNETPHEFYVRNSKEERARTIAAYEEARQRYQDGLAKAAREKILVVMSESEPAIHELLLKRLQKGRKKLSSESIAKGIVRVRDHRDHTDSYVWRGKVVLRVKYTTSGFEVQQ